MYLASHASRFPPGPGAPLPDPTAPLVDQEVRCPGVFHAAGALQLHWWP